MSPRPARSQAQTAGGKPAASPRRRSIPAATRAAPVAPDFSATPLAAIRLAGLDPRARIAPNFRVYELTRSDLASRRGIANGFASEAELHAAIHLARHVLQPSCHKKMSKHLCLLRLLRPCPYPVMTLPTLWQVC